MADEGASIFNKKATERLRSPDDLDKYVRVANPSVWVVLVACLSLLAGLLAWGVFGSVTTSVSATGVSTDGQVVCFLDGGATAKVKEGNEANVGGETMMVEKVSSIPLSRDEVRSMVGNDYLVSTLMPGDWAYVVEFGGGQNLEQGVPLSVTIMVERTRPISLILGDSKASS